MSGPESSDLAGKLAAQSAAPRMKRFYTAASAAPTAEGGFRIELDGRPVRTPGRRIVQVPVCELAEVMAAEWAGQGEFIDPMTMPVTRLVNSALDGVEANRDAVAAEIVRYAGSDLLCYRTDGPAALVALQSQIWDPLLDWAREEIGATFFLSEGVVYVEQPPRSLEAIAAHLPDDALRLAALNLLTTLSGSALVALALWGGRLTADGAWRAAHIDEEVQEQAWGSDAEATARRAARFRDFAAAALCLELIERAERLSS
ncbi:ATP12 family chaperone protein [Ancylobacter sp. SL191]|uniref:ATP12 family chaperone protein n=1 Tax=Ancylobacter sp. SL191 TaxID=2995166 RepID=UPI0022705154|nr:ATP12 family protein [Ancylobacter sp. SL191]WAC25948.1 ATPase [Ancylobacter sp. SL191]